MSFHKCHHEQDARPTPDFLNLIEEFLTAMRAGTQPYCRAKKFRKANICIIQCCTVNNLAQWFVAYAFCCKEFDMGVRKGGSMGLNDPPLPKARSPSHLKVFTIC